MSSKNIFSNDTQAQEETAFTREASAFKVVEGQLQLGIKEIGLWDAGKASLCSVFELGGKKVIKATSVFGDRFYTLNAIGEDVCCNLVTSRLSGLPSGIETQKYGTRVISGRAELNLPDRQNPAACFRGLNSRKPWITTLEQRMLGGEVFNVVPNGSFERAIFGLGRSIQYGIYRRVQEMDTVENACHRYVSFVQAYPNMGGYTALEVMVAAALNNQAVRLVYGDFATEQAASSPMGILGFWAYQVRLAAEAHVECTDPKIGFQFVDPKTGATSEFKGLDITKRAVTPEVAIDTTPVAAPAGFRKINKNRR